MADNRVDGYLIKYALSEGIIRVDGAELCSGGYVRATSNPCFFVRDGREFVRTREEAETAAKAMALRKIASLEKQIAELRVLATKPRWSARRNIDG